MAADPQLYDEELGQQIYMLHLGGIPLFEISERMGIPQESINRYFRRYKTQVEVEQAVFDRAFLSQLELDRLGLIQDAFWDKAMAADIKAGNLVLKVIDMRIKLLGLEELHKNGNTQVANILVVGKDKQDFVRALMDGRNGDTEEREDEDERRS